MRVGHLGPAGTFTEEAARRSGPAGPDGELVPYPSVPDTLDALLAGEVELALVPIENSLEGTVTATVDALSADERLRMVGEVVLPIRQHLIAREEIELAAIEEVRSHPQGLAQAARFLRSELPRARLVPVASTAEAVRDLPGGPSGVAAIGSRAAAELHGGVILREDVEDDDGNATRFAWLAAGETSWAPAGGEGFKTSILFAGSGDDSPGWLVRCLSEFAFRGVNLVKIESRPARRQLGHYLFLADCEGRSDERPVAEAVTALGAHCDRVRVLGTYPAAPSVPVS